MEDVPNRPEEVMGAAKYCGFNVGACRGLFTKDSFSRFNLDLASVDILVKASNNSLSTQTWNNYRTVRNHIRKCQALTGREFTFPFTEEMVLSLVSYWLHYLGLQGTTVSSYLSGLRMIHFTQGYPDTLLRSSLVSVVFEGKKNWVGVQLRLKPPRLAVTIRVLELLKAVLAVNKEMNRQEEALVWSISTLAFWGSFRAGELVSKESRKIDPENMLLRRDVMVDTVNLENKKARILRVTLKSSKESRAYCKNCSIEVFANNTSLCPVAAFLDYVSLMGRLDEDSAAFRTPEGWAYRHQKFNRDLKKLLSPYIPYGKISGHSFRSGLASLLGARGYDDETIKTVGRWSSDAFKVYVKMTRIMRMSIAQSLAEAVSSGNQGRRHQSVSW